MTGKVGRRAAWMTAALFLPLAAQIAEASQAMPKKPDAAHRGILTIDTHVDIPLNFATEAFDPANSQAPFSKVDLARMDRGGLDAAFFVVYIPQDRLGPAYYAKAAEIAFRRFAAIRRMTDILYPDRIGLARSAADVRRLDKEGKRVALIGVENAWFIGEHVDMVDVAYELGARYLSLVHNGHNQLADSAQPEEKFGDGATRHGGLSELGRRVIKRCNELGIMVDVSHASSASTLQTIQLSAAPVIASHSAMKALLDHPRNLSDEEAKALAAKGGVIQVVAVGEFLRPISEERKAARKAIEKKYGLDKPGAEETLDRETLAKAAAEYAEVDERLPGATVSDLVDHIDYAVRLVGIDHVGIASDFQGGGSLQGWTDAAETANVTAELRKRGYTPDQIAKIWGGNLLRVMEAVEAKRTRRQSGANLARSKGSSD